MNKYKLGTKIKLSDKIVGFLNSNKVEGYCGRCDNPVFNTNTKWAKEGLCINCWERTKKPEFNITDLVMKFSHEITSDKVIFFKNNSNNKTLLKELEEEIIKLIK